MPASIFNTPYAGIDCALTKSKLEGAKASPDQLRDVLTDCFFDGSTAASEAAAVFVLNTTASEGDAVLVSDIIKSLPTAVPKRTAAALAQICVFLATSFHRDECKEPLNTFCYADSTVKQIAIRAAVSALDDLLRVKPHRFRQYLSRVRPFFAVVMGQGSDVQERFVALRGLVNVGMLSSEMVGQTLAEFILECASEQNAFEEDDSVVQNEQDYDAFFALELVTLMHSNRAISRVVLRCLLRSLEWSNVTTVYSLWMNKKSKLLQCLPLIGMNVFLFIMIVIATSTACEGKISECRQAMFIALNMLQNTSAPPDALDEVVSLSVSSLCVAVGAMCSACGANDVARCSALVCDLVKGMSVRNKAKNKGVFAKSLQRVSEEAGRWKCSKAALCLGLVFKLSSLWSKPQVLKDWMNVELDHLLCSAALDDANSKKAESVYQKSPGLAFDDNQASNAECESEEQGDLLSALSIACIALVCLSHAHGQVRYAAANSLANVRRGQVLLFFIPAIITHLESETNGVISVLCVQRIFLSSCLLAHEETEKIALQTLLSLIRRGRGSNATGSYQSGLVAIAGAVRTAPATATSLLLAELEKLKNSFGLLSADTKTAACAAVLQVVSIRPARGTSFIPFINLCITRENMESAPESSAVSFDAMRVMCEEEVLDAVKAVKIVLKSFPDVLNVHARARLSYLRLLGRVSAVSSGKKGRIIAERVIILLRDALVNLYPSIAERRAMSSISERLTWKEMGEAAESLRQYNIEDILCISHAQEEALADAEAEQERLEQVAKECMSLTDDLISVTELSRQAETSATKQLQKLVDGIVKHEWESRQRSKFDPEHIAKLRATSEALRRARQARGDTVESVEGGTASEQFSRAVGTLPVGVIRGVYERCARGRGISGECKNRDSNKKLNMIRGRASALYAIVGAGGLSVAFPWVGLVKEILEDNASGAEEKAGALSVLRNVKDASFEACESRTRWFGENSPLFNEGTAIGNCEAKEMFVGIVQHSGQEVGGILYRSSRQVSQERLLLMIDAFSECTIGDKVRCSIMDGLMEILLCMQWVDGGSVKYRDSVETRFAELLSRCGTDYVERTLQLDSTTETLTRLERFQIRIICNLRESKLFKKCVRRVVGVAASGGNIGAELRGMLGRSISQRTWDERRGLIYDICGAGPKGGGPVGLEMGAYCLGVGGLVTSGADEGLLVAAGALCGRKEKPGVQKMVSRLCGY